MMDKQRLDALEAQLDEAVKLDSTRDIYLDRHAEDVIRELIAQLRTPPPEGTQIKPPPPSGIRNCYISMKPGDGPLFSEYETPFGWVFVANLDGYEIKPLTAATDMQDALSKPLQDKMAETESQRWRYLSTDRVDPHVLTDYELGKAHGYVLGAHHRERYKQGDRVLVARPSGHLEVGTVTEDVAAIWVQHDDDGVLRPYKPTEVSPLSEVSPPQNCFDSQPKEKS